MKALKEKSKKLISARVVSTAMTRLAAGSPRRKGVAVVEVERTKSHRLYGKRYKVSKRIKAIVGSGNVEVGDMVQISETRPVSRDVHFEIKKIEAK